MSSPQTSIVPVLRPCGRWIESPLERIVIELTKAQIEAIGPASPIELVPGVDGQTILPLRVSFKITITGAYVNQPTWIVRWAGVNPNPIASMILQANVVAVHQAIGIDQSVTLNSLSNIAIGRTLQIESGEQLIPGGTGDTTGGLIVVWFVRDPYPM